jgi:hypothetical protein
MPQPPSPRPDTPADVFARWRSLSPVLRRWTI